MLEKCTLFFGIEFSSLYSTIKYTHVENLITKKQTILLSKIRNKGKLMAMGTEWKYMILYNMIYMRLFVYIFK